MLSAARRSRFGVNAPLAPRKPMRSARVEQRVISTRLGLDAAAAKERLIKIRLTPATNFRIMTVSVEAAPALIKTSTPSLDAHRSPRTILCTCSSDFQSHPDVVITTHRYPGRQPGSQSGSRTIFCSDCALQKTSSCGMPAGSVRRGVEPPSLLPSCSGRSGWVQEADHPWY